MRPTRGTTIPVTLLVAAAWLGSSQAPAADPPDLIVAHASVYTGGSGRAQALAITGPRITAVGSDAEVLRLRGPRTRVIDAGGRLVIPGINDAHLHWSVRPDGTTLELASMDPGWADVLAALGAAAARAPRGSWIYGTIGAGVLDDARAERAALDAIAPDHSVLLEAWTGHGILLNTAAMRGLAVPDDPRDASNGSVGRDARGRFNGWLFEYPEWRATARLPTAVPRPQALRELEGWAGEAASFGITSVQVMPGVPVDEFAALLREAGVRLRTRIIAFPFSREQALPRIPPSELLRASGIKWILDGTPVERGAAIRRGYADRPAARGELDFPEAFVLDALRAAAARNEQSLFHCAGDRCAEAVLRAMEAASEIAWPERRVRIEHGDGLLPDLVPRAKRLGVVVVQNPTHFTIGDVMRARYGADHGYMPLRSLLQAGVPIAFGSDGPMNPFLNIQLANAHPTRPEEALTREQALDAYTRGSAFAEGEERDKGSVAVGQLADLAILSQDILTAPAEALPATTSLLTLVGGQVVHDAGLVGRVRAFTGARVFDGTGGTVDNATLVVREGRVVAVGPDLAVPAGAERVDLAGRFVIPGLVNAHGHVGATVGLRSGPELYTRDNVLDQLGRYARYGVTTVVSLGDDREEGFRVRDEQDVATLDRARLYVAGPVVDATTPEAARAQVEALAARKVDWVKIRVDDTLGTTAKMPPTVYRAVIDEAHARGLRVAAHLFYLEDAQGLLAAGVDFIAHSVRDKPVDPAFVAALAKRGTCLCPTLMREVSAFTYAEEPAFFSDPFFLKEADPAVVAELRSPERRERARANPATARYREALRTASLNLKSLVDAGAKAAFGTDTGPPARFQGYFEHEELRLMVEAGLTPAQALVAATSGAAHCMGFPDLGRLEPGAWADFVVLREDPLADIRNTRSLESVWIAGNRVPARGAP